MSDASSIRGSAGTPGITAPELADAMGGRVLRGSPRLVVGGAVDSRRVTDGSCFFALPGERTDGHLFLADAARRGAGALVVTAEPSEADVQALQGASRGGVSIVVVPDGLRALQQLAAWWRARFEPLVVGVTGSIAKTSTKEAIAETLSERRTVLRNEGNENNEVGLPLTLLRLAPQHDVAVLEMGMYVVGEIALLARLARPKVGVVTAVRGVHLSRASSLDAIERGKGELVEALPPEGTAVLNADDPRVARMATRTAAQVLRYGFDATADVRGEAVESLGERGTRFVLRSPSGSMPIETPALGRHSAHNLLAAAAVALVAGLDLDAIRRGAARGFRAPHRNTLLHAGDWRIIDDTYNAAPDSMAAALEVLADLPGRRIAALGQMLELGEDAEEAHRGVGRLAARVVDRLVLIGDGVTGIADGALESGLPAQAIVHLPDRDAALELLLEELRPGDMILVKGSRGVALDLLVDRLVEAQGGAAAQPETAAARGARA